MLGKDRISCSDQAVGWTIRGSKPGGGDVYLLYDVKTEYGTRAASYPMSTGDKAAGM
jgi:hypothetical protein